MIILASTTDKIQVVTGSAVAACVMHASWVDNASGTITPGRSNQSISTVATTDLVAAPAASTYRNLKFLSVRNTNVSTNNTVTIQHTDGTTAVILWQGVLAAGMAVQINDSGLVTVFANGGMPLTPSPSNSLYNFSTASQATGFATDTYVTGSNIAIPSQRPRAGTIFQVRIAATKTAAGTATPIVVIRYGNGASITDTALCTFTFGAGTAATDTGVFLVTGVYRTTGSGTIAIMQGSCQLDATPSAGFSSTSKAVVATSAGHDSTNSSFLGVSINGGLSAVWTVTSVLAELSYI